MEDLLKKIFCQDSCSQNLNSHSRVHYNSVIMQSGSETFSEELLLIT